MDDLLSNKENCTGCTACYNICKHKAIRMISDNLGFLYPIIDANRCVDCGLCIKVCPKNKELNYDPSNKQIFYGISKDPDTVMSSSSGGAFTELLQAIDQNHSSYKCYAAEYSNGKVFHSCITSVHELCRQKKSKYTQSLLSDTYSSIKNDLYDGKYVVFVGTPCQVDGLNSYLQNKNYDNLLTIDLLCTGTCSPQLLLNHVRYLEKKQHCHIKKYDMRKKEFLTGKWDIMNTEILYDNGKRELVEDKYFIGCFRQHIAFRSSCYHCKYTNIQRPSDITLGDYWKFDSDFSYDGFKGISLIIVNTKKGEYWLDKLKQRMFLKETTIEDIREQQPSLRCPVKKPTFVVPNEIATINGSIRFMKRYYRGSLKIRILEKVSHSLPSFISTFLKKIYYSIK